MPRFLLALQNREDKGKTDNGVALAAIPAKIDAYAVVMEALLSA
jgi:hypothetical protein